MNNTGHTVLFRSGTSFPVPTIEQFTTAEVIRRLVEVEEKLGKTSIELFQEYISVDRLYSEELEDWFDFFFLFLGTPEIKQLTTLDK